MSLLVRAALAAAVVCAFAALAPVAPAAAPVPPKAGQVVTFPFPAKAPVVVQLTGVGAARERLSALLKGALGNDAADVEKLIDDGLKQLLADRKLTAVPKDGRVYLAINDIAALFEGTPAVSLLVPVTTYKEFRDTFLTADEQKTFEAGKGVDEVKLSAFGNDHTVYMVDLKEYVALSPDKGTADLYTTKFTHASTTGMPSELAKSFVGSDLALFVNLDLINDTYGEQIKNFKMLIDFGIQQAQMGGVLPGIGKKQLDAMKGLLQGAFQALGDCHGLVVAAEFRPEGLNLRVQAQFAEDTTSVKVLKAETPGPLADLGKMPAGLAQYMGTKYGKSFVEAARGLNAEFAPADDDEKGNAAVEKLQAALVAAGPQGEVAGIGGAANTLTVAKYADAKKAAAALLGCYEAMSAGGKVQGTILKDAPKVTADAQKHAGFTFAEVKMEFDFEATVKDLPEGVKENTIAQLKRGVAERQSIWVGTDGKQVVQVVAKDWAAARAAVDDYFEAKKPVGEVEGFKVTRKQLPADASLLLMVEVGQTATSILDSLRMVQDAVPGFPKIGKAPELKGPPAFVGLAITLKGDTATANVFVPGAAIAAARKIVAGLLTNID